MKNDWFHKLANEFGFTINTKLGLCDTVFLPDIEGNLMNNYNNLLESLCNCPSQCNHLKKSGEFIITASSITYYKEGLWFSGVKLYTNYQDAKKHIKSLLRKIKKMKNELLLEDLKKDFV